ncbi:2-hydroxyacid dehydrogenase [Hylemonella sp. W303a]|uniref:2-hydroxyacid dehydrogenase n=1 Tax=Hylemonella sp. W303a TaxID=3389873 RepID=UPI00396B1560
MTASQPPTLLVCSETDDLRGLCESLRRAAAIDCPGLRVALWAPHEGLGMVDPASVVALAAWFAPQGLPARLPALKLVASIGAGVEHVLRDTALPESLPVTRIVDPEQARGMAEFVLWAVLHYHRGLDQVQQQQARRVWRMPPQRPASQTRVGIMGLGAMGAVVATTLAAHGFTVSGWSRGPRVLEGVTVWSGDDRMADFLAPLDVVVSLLPLTEQTRNLCNADWLARLKPGAVLVNCGRGEQVVVADLIDALSRGHLRAAVLDVFAHEPLPEDSPLWTTPGVVVTPHMGSAASDEVIARQIVVNTARVLAGQAPLHTVDRQRGY